MTVRVICDIAELRHAIETSVGGEVIRLRGTSGEADFRIVGGVCEPMWPPPVEVPSPVNQALLAAAKGVLNQRAMIELAEEAAGAIISHAEWDAHAAAVTEANG